MNCHDYSCLFVCLQVSARESLARLRARQMAENNQASAGDGSRYQSMDEGPLEEEEDHNGLYESVDYQAVNKTEDTSTSVDNVRPVRDSCRQ